MKKLTSIEVRCQCNIPFHTELVTYLTNLSDDTIKTEDNLIEPPHKEAMMQALETKLIFIKIDFDSPIEKDKPKLLAAVKNFFGKEVIGYIKGAKDEITLILN